MAEDKSKTTTTTTTSDEEDKNFPEQGKPQLQSDQDTETARAATLPPVEKQGEQVIDRTADAHTLKEQPAEDRIAQAQADAFNNHAAEHANDSESYDSTTSRDKVKSNSK